MFPNNVKSRGLNVGDVAQKILKVYQTDVENTSYGELLRNARQKRLSSKSVSYGNHKTERYSTGTVIDSALYELRYHIWAPGEPPETHKRETIDLYIVNSSPNTTKTNRQLLTIDIFAPSPTSASCLLEITKTYIQNLGADCTCSVYSLDLPQKLQERIQPYIEANADEINDL